MNDTTPSDDWPRCMPTMGIIVCPFCKIGPVTCTCCGVVLGCHLKATPLRCEKCKRPKP